MSSLVFKTNGSNTSTFHVASHELSFGHGVFQVEQIGEAKILWLTQRFRTLLRVTEDARDPSRLMTSFDLIRSVSCHAQLGLVCVARTENVSSTPLLEVCIFSVCLVLLVYGC